MPDRLLGERVGESVREGSRHVCTKLSRLGRRGCFGIASARVGTREGGPPTGNESGRKPKMRRYQYCMDGRKDKLDFVVEAFLQLRFHNSVHSPIKRLNDVAGVGGDGDDDDVLFHAGLQERHRHMRTMRVKKYDNGRCCRETRCTFELKKRMERPQHILFKRGTR